MASVVAYDAFELPLSVGDFAEFRRWSRSPEFPTVGRIDYLDERIEVDMSPENLFCHGTVKTEIASVLHQISRKTAFGEVFIDRTRVACPTVGLSVEPDVVVVGFASIEAGRVSLVPTVSGEADQFVELEGAPDLIVEIISESSEAKDLRYLPPLYFAAGVRELWLVDARHERVEFQILVPQAEGFVPQPVADDGYRHSKVLGFQFLLERSRNRIGTWKFDLLWRNSLE